MEAIVFIKNKNKTYSGIIIENEGQVDQGVGEILFEHYTTKSQIEDLIEQGKALVLKEKLEECEFYMRDYNENYESLEADNLQELEELVWNRNSFIYLFTDNVWYTADYSSTEMSWELLEDYF